MLRIGKIFGQPPKPEQKINYTVPLPTRGVRPGEFFISGRLTTQVLEIPTSVKGDERLSVPPGLTATRTTAIDCIPVSGLDGTPVSYASSTRLTGLSARQGQEVFQISQLEEAEAERLAALRLKNQAAPTDDSETHSFNILNFLLKIFIGA